VSSDFDIAIIGAGIAGASLAAEIGEEARVLLLEAEDMPGYHSTGRSAAFWEECYGGPDIVPLTRASGPYLEANGFLSPRGALYLAREEDELAIEGFFARFADSGAEFTKIGRRELEVIVPGLKPHWDRAIRQVRCADIDVAGLHAHFLARAKATGVALVCRARVASLVRHSDWYIKTAGCQEYTATTIVNAAGAWADDIAKMAGVAAKGIQPYRRTVAQLRVDPTPPSDLPLCLDISGNFYFRPEGDKLWLSPHDETPCMACDAAPEELDVALAIDRLEEATNWKIEAVERKWAGLRSFSADRLPIYGRDPALPEFFWFAGQGGFGIQTSPAAARLGAQLILGKSWDEVTDRLQPAIYSPDRFDRE